jgi:hypothetical protein
VTTVGSLLAHTTLRPASAAPIESFGVAVNTIPCPLASVVAGALIVTDAAVGAEGVAGARGAVGVTFSPPLQATSIGMQSVATAISPRMNSHNV